MPETSAIEVSGLSAGYGGATVLESIDLTVAPRDYVGIIGPNGGGKTTLLRAILGFIEPTAGRVRIFGEPPAVGRRWVGYVPQYPDVDRAYPIAVWDVVLMGRRAMRGMSPRWTSEDRAAARDALRTVDMLGHRGDPIGGLSGGQLQRVFIARALVGHPRVLIMDEPTASLDSRLQESVYDLLAELNDEMAIVLVTHDIGVVSSHVRQVACLNRRLYTHGDADITADMLEQAYHCPVDLIAHGVPHRVFAHHDHGDDHGGDA